MSTLARQLARFASDLRYEDLPADVIERVRLHALDLIGVCLLGAPMPFAHILRATLAQSGGAPEATLIGSGGLKLPSPSATLYNGGLAHGNEFDDTYAPGRWHGSAPLVPPALAIAEALRADGKSFIAALSAGLEAGCRLTRAAPGLLNRGFHSTCTAGIYGATLAVGKLMALRAAQLTEAMGICGSFASGTTEFLSDPEPWSKRIQVGYAGHGAIIAARLALNGFRGPHTILEGRYGYFRSYAGVGNFDLSGVTAALGSDWQVRYLYPKRYPCDHCAQGYVDCAIEVAKTERIAANDIARVDCIVHPLVAAVMFEPRDIRYRPSNGWSTRWSMPFNLAVALTDRTVTVDSYTDARANDPATRNLMAKVGYVTDPSLAFPLDYPAWIRVHTRDGRVLERKALKVVGSTENPMSAEEYEQKFMRNACRSITREKAAALIERMRSLASVKNMAELAALYG